MHSPSAYIQNIRTHTYIHVHTLARIKKHAYTLVYTHTTMHEYTIYMYVHTYATLHTLTSTICTYTHTFGTLTLVVKTARPIYSHL